MITSPTAPECRMIPLADIPTDEASQPRARIRPGVVRDYAAAMTAQLKDGGLRFPPIVVFTNDPPGLASGERKPPESGGGDCVFADSEGSRPPLAKPSTDEPCPTQTYWLGDGYHRVLAARKAGLTEFQAEIHQGTLRDAVLFGISANCTHGLPRTNADKRKAISLLLGDAEWSQWSDREIAKRCQVGHSFVSRMRSGASVHGGQIARKVQRAGSIYEMSVKSANGKNTTTALAHAIGGVPLPASRARIFESLGPYKEAHAALEHLAKLLDLIAKGQAGELYGKQLIWSMAAAPGSFICPDLRACRKKLEAAEPYCAYCPRCYPSYPDQACRECPICRGRGWTTKAEFETCTVREREYLLGLLKPANCTAPGTPRERVR